MTVTRIGICHPHAAAYADLISALTGTPAIWRDTRGPRAPSTTLWIDGVEVVLTEAEAAPPSIGITVDHPEATAGRLLALDGSVDVAGRVIDVAGVQLALRETPARPRGGFPDYDDAADAVVIRHIDITHPRTAAYAAVLAALTSDPMVFDTVGILDADDTDDDAPPRYVRRGVFVVGGGVIDAVLSEAEAAPGRSVAVTVAAAAPDAVVARLAALPGATLERDQAVETPAGVRVAVLGRRSDGA